MLTKKPYPLGSICLNGKRYDLIEIEKPKVPYVILDILNKDKNVVRGVHIVKMESKGVVKLVRRVNIFRG